MAFYGIPMFGEGLVSKTLDNTIKGKGASVAQQQLNRGLQQTRRGMMGQAAADRSNPALAVRNAMLAGSQAATDTNMQAAQLRAQEQATALGQRMAQGQQQGQQFFGQLGAIGKGLAASGVLSPEVSAAVGAMSGLAPGQTAPQAPSAARSGGNISTAQRITQPLMNQGVLGQPRFSADNIAANAFNAKPPMAAPASAPGGNITTPTPPAPQMDPNLMAIYNSATARSGAPAGEMMQQTAYTDPVIRSNQNEMAFGLPGLTQGQMDVMNAPLVSSNESGMVFGEAQPAQAQAAAPSGNITTPAQAAARPQPIRLEPIVIRGNVPGPAAPQSPAQAVLAGQPQAQPVAEPYRPPGAPIPYGPQGPLPPELARETARRIAEDREVRGFVSQASAAILPSLRGMGPLVPGTEPFRPSKDRPGELRDPAMVYQDPNRMVFSYDPQDSRRAAEQYGMQPDSGFGVPPEASSPGTGLAQEDIDAYVRRLGGR